AAVVGVEVAVPFLSDLVGGPEEPGVVELDEALQEAIEARLVTADGPVCRFRHALERQAVDEEGPRRGERGGRGAGAGGRGGAAGAGRVAPAGGAGPGGGGERRWRGARRGVGADRGALGADR